MISMPEEPLTLQRFAADLSTVPTGTAWALADLGEARGKQELFTRQSPQRLRVLREHALIESAVSSNRIEGIEVDHKRVGTLVFGQAALFDRDEEEVRAYRNALNLIHKDAPRLGVSQQTVRLLHRLSRGQIWDAGKYKQRDGDIIERYPDGRVRVRFSPTPAGQTPQRMKALVGAWRDCLRERWIHPLVAMAAFNLDFLCIHPFRDGNGRVSRLLLLLQCYHAGMEVGRYVSLERVIEQNKERYYETLELSSQGWHEARNDPWRYVNYLLFVLKEAYKEFEARVGQTAAPRGAKGELVQSAVSRQPRQFRLADIERACPGVSRDRIRAVLREMKAAGEVRSTGRGPGARWERTGRLNKGSNSKKG